MVLFKIAMYDIRIKNKRMRKSKEKPTEQTETIWEREHRIKRTAKASIPLLHEIERDKLKRGFKYMSNDNGKTSVLVNPKNFEKRLNENYKFVKE